MFIAYEIYKQLIVELRPIVPLIQARDRDLADQLKRAAQSVLLDLAEGQKFRNGNRRKHYEIAQGSANEVKAALDAAEGMDRGERRGERGAGSVARRVVEAHALASDPEARPRIAASLMIRCRERHADPVRLPPCVRTAWLR